MHPEGQDQCAAIRMVRLHSISSAGSLPCRTMLGVHDVARQLLQVSWNRLTVVHIKRFTHDLGSIGMLHAEVNCILFNAHVGYERRGGDTKCDSRHPKI